MISSRKLTLDDISDARAYEREREQLRGDVLAIKQRRRVSMGTVVALVFENRETMRYQIQEMARVGARSLMTASWTGWRSTTRWSPSPVTCAQPCSSS